MPGLSDLELASSLYDCNLTFCNDMTFLAHKHNLEHEARFESSMPRSIRIVFKHNARAIHVAR